MEGMIHFHEYPSQEDTINVLILKLEMMMIMMMIMSSGAN